MKALNVNTAMKLVMIINIWLVMGCNMPESQYDANQVAMWESPGDTLRGDSVIQPPAPPAGPDSMPTIPTGVTPPVIPRTTPKITWDTSVINTRSLTPSDLLAFAEAQLGVRYRYASTDPQKGFDCSGFITYVFNHFGVKVPRSSVDFTHVGKRVDISEAKVGDIILFTGTDSTIRRVGHMGIIQSIDKDGLHFIHSSSGKAFGVTITPLNAYYQGRFMSIRRIFPQNEW